MIHWKSIFLTTSLMAFNGCILFNTKLDDEINFPPEALHLPAGTSIKEDIHSIAWRINDQGRLIGWTNSHNRPLYRFYDGASEGFAIDTNRQNFTHLQIQGAHSVWPMGINNAGTIVGTAMLSEHVKPLSPSIEAQIATPCFAFKINGNGEGYLPLKQNSAAATSATHINEAGVIGGFYVDSIVDPFAVEKACIWMSDTSEYISLHPEGMQSSRVKAMNENYVVTQVTGTDSSYIVLTTLPELAQSVILTSPGIEFLDAEDINDQDVLVGSKLKSFTSQIGYVYNVQTSEIQWIEGSVIKGKWEYREFKPHAISNDGTIVGIARRKPVDTPGLQNRAAILNLDISQMVDVTPSNRNTYAEAYSINEHGSIVGYAGFSAPSGYVENKAFILP